MRPARGGRASMRGGLMIGVLIITGLVLIALWIWGDDIRRTELDPKQPYQTYRPPPAPDYAQRASWALLPADLAHAEGDGPADVFFIHPTTYNGGRDWNGPVADRSASAILQRAVLPNDAGPFARAGRVFAPRYRQASLYALLTLRDDARDARLFAYGDVRRAFDAYLARWSGGRPLVIVGVEQGGLLAARLGAEVAADPALKARLVALYLPQTAVPASEYGADALLPACSAPSQTGCVIAFVPTRVGESQRDARARTLERAAVWTPRGQLDPWERQAPLCVNPVTGSIAAPASDERDSRGAVNATGLEWGERPALLPGQFAADCDADGLLHVTQPRSPSLKERGDWAERLRVPAFNLFYADEEADVVRRVKAFGRRRG